jgi:hypothetical protein
MIERKSGSKWASLTVALVRVSALILISWIAFGVAERSLSLRGQNRRSWFSAAQVLCPIGASLIRDYPDTLDERSRSRIEAALKDYGSAGRLIWLIGSTRTALRDENINTRLSEADALFQESAREMIAAFRDMAGSIKIPESMAAKIVRSISLPFRSGVIVIQSAGHLDPSATLIREKLDLSFKRAFEVEIEDPRDFLCILELAAAPTGRHDYEIAIKSSGNVAATINLSVIVPRQLSFRVSILDSTTPTAAAIGLYSQTDRLLVPNNALDFSSAGYHYELAAYRNHSNAVYWPGGNRLARCFFVKGAFSVNLPSGSYQLIASKGPEYVTFDQNILVNETTGKEVKIDLQRWVDMKKLGWYSGDCHVHYARPNVEVNRSLMLWAEAEDVSVANILRMGDARETYFEQYAFGTPGRFAFEKRALVPGQEDPRTGVLGHTIQLNLKRPIRDAARYYLYSLIFDEARRQGGLAGYAHVNTGNFLVERDMTLNVPRGKVDFAEICEFGQVGVDLYYEFLNLGFKLTAAAGSDVPWGGTVGESRVYAYTGDIFSVDRWFDALKRGRTFVTGGPMLDFSVDGHLPGDEINLDERKSVRVHAQARVGSDALPLGPLEIVVNGEVVRSAGGSGRSAVLNYELPAKDSMWIAARGPNCHTTPVYITFKGRRHWRATAVSALLEKRFRTLDDIERLLDEEGRRIVSNRQPEWENVAAFRRGIPELRRMVREARMLYETLQGEYQRDQNTR